MKAFLNVTVKFADSGTIARADGFLWTLTRGGSRPPGRRAVRPGSCPSITQCKSRRCKASSRICTFSLLLVGFRASPTLLPCSRPCSALSWLGSRGLGAFHTLRAPSAHRRPRRLSAAWSDEPGGPSMSWASLGCPWRRRRPSPRGIPGPRGRARPGADKPRRAAPAPRGSFPRGTIHCAASDSTGDGGCPVPNDARYPRAVLPRGDVDGAGHDRSGMPGAGHATGGLIPLLGIPVAGGSIPCRSHPHPGEDPLGDCIRGFDSYGPSSRPAPRRAPERGSAPPIEWIRPCPREGPRPGPARGSPTRTTARSPTLPLLSLLVLGRRGPRRACPCDSPRYRPRSAGRSEKPGCPWRRRCPPSRGDFPDPRSGLVLRKKNPGGSVGPPGFALPGIIPNAASDSRGRRALAHQ